MMLLQREQVPNQGLKWPTNERKAREMYESKEYNFLSGDLSSINPRFCVGF